jgi:diguanylate cyclase (GGDEF)-like protein
LKIIVDWKVYLSFGIFFVLCLPIVHKLGLRDVLYFFVVIYSLVGICLGISLRKPEQPSPWIYFLLSIASEFVGALIQANTDASGEFGARLSPADCFLLLGHLLMVASLWQLASKLHREFPEHGFFQGWILATSLILIGWQFLFLPTIIKYGFSIGHPQIFRMIYPTMSYIEIGILLWVWTSNQANQSKAFPLLVMGVVSFAAGETVFHGTSYSMAVPNDSNLMLWLLGYVFFGAVVLHPNINQLLIPRSSEESRDVSAVLSLQLPLALLLPVTLLVIYFKELHPATTGILVGFFLVIVIGWYQLIKSMQSIVKVTRLMEKQNRTDYLTGIPNRNHIEHVIGVNVDNLSRGYNGLLLIDIDGFKVINDTFGFSVGDFTLKAIAERLHTDSLKRGYHFARVDGDEFTLLMCNIKNRQDIQAQAWHVHRLLDKPISINSISIKMTCSIGISISSVFEKLSFTNMLKESERALVWAKKSQSQVEEYAKNKDIEEDRSWVAADFRRAITEHQLVMYYQPKVHINTQRVIGVEALIRWQHPERGLLTPDKFLPQIEETDLIHSLFAMVLNDTTQQWRVWKEQGLDICIALNVTARDLMSYDLVREISSALTHNNMPAMCMEIELTESSALSNPAHAKSVLTNLMNLGVKISIDDYGTGYSSLLHLQQLPLHYLKIDQQFIREILNDKYSETIVRSTIELAKNLNLEVIAEGVEDVRVYQQLQHLGCYAAQGYLFSKAVPAARVSDIIRKIEAAVF